MSSLALWPEPRPKARNLPTRLWCARRRSSRRTEFHCRASTLLLCNREEAPLEVLTDTLMERVDNLVQASKGAPLEWGSPLLSVTPTSIAIRELAAEIEALKCAVREIALEVQKVSTQG